MAKASGNSISATAVGLQDWIALSPGANRLSIKCANWSTSSTGLRYSDDGEDASEVVIKDGVGGITGSELAFTANGFYDLNGPGYVTLDLGAYGGTAVTLRVERITPVLGPR